MNCSVLSLCLFLPPSLIPSLSISPPSLFHTHILLFIISWMQRAIQHTTNCLLKFSEFFKSKNELKEITSQKNNISHEQTLRKNLVVINSTSNYNYIGSVLLFREWERGRKEEGRENETDSERMINSDFLQSRNVTLSYNYHTTI